MDHAVVQEWLDEAFFTPAALEADETAARAVREHLATCSQCTEHADALRRAAMKLDLARGPSTHVRQRVLTSVRSVGRPRRDAPTQETTGRSRRWWPQGLDWRLAAAALVVGVIAAGLGMWVGRVSAPADSEMHDLTAALAMMTDLAGRPDTTEMVLRDAAGAPGGVAMISTAAHEVAVFTSALPAPSQEGSYACWFEHAGQRTWVGRMHAANGVEYWAGDMEEMPAMAAGDRIVVAESATAPEVLGAAFH